MKKTNVSASGNSCQKTSGGKIHNATTATTKKDDSLKKEPKDVVKK